MMSVNRRWLLYFSIPLICGMRDPFVPVIDPCQTAQLSLWRYRGVLQSDERRIGLLQSSENQWHRTEQGKRLDTGWRVNDITHDNVTVDVGPGCEPRYWQWKREGMRDDKKDKSADGVDGAAAESGEKRHAGG